MRMGDDDQQIDNRRPDEPLTKSKIKNEKDGGKYSPHRTRTR